MIDTLPLSLIAVRAMNIFWSRSLFRQITDTMLIDLLQDLTISIIIKITSNENLWL